MNALADTAYESIHTAGLTSLELADTVAREHGQLVFPKASADACYVAAYAMLKTEQAFERQCFLQSLLTPLQRTFGGKYPVIDFHFWVMYGSWSNCPNCGSFFYNDEYFRERLYQNQANAVQGDLMAAYRRQVPSDPVEHTPGAVGESSRWWYWPNMFKPLQYCGRCTRPPTAEQAGQVFSEMLRTRRRLTSKTNVPVSTSPPVSKTSQLYCIPYLGAAGPVPVECRTWPRYRWGRFDDSFTAGDSMLELNQEERRALAIVVLNTKLAKETYGAHRHYNWKKVGLSWAHFRAEAVSEESLPTERCKAAFRYLLENNKCYKYYQDMCFLL